MKALLILTLFCGAALAQSENAKESLIAVHYDSDHKAELVQTIYRYDFVNGIYTGRSLIMSVKGRVNDKEQVRLDMGANVLYRQRYLISTAGDILDLQDKKVLYDGAARLIYCRNDSVVMFTNDAFKGKYYSFYDLKTNTYAEIKSLTYKAIMGQDIEFDKRQDPYKIFLYPVNKAKVLLLDDAGYGQGIRNIDPPLCWTDQNTFIFARFSQGGNEGTLLKYAIDTKSKTVIGSFSAAGNTGLPATIQKNSGGTYDFRFKNTYYNIDAAGNTLTEVKKIKLGGHYEADPEDKAAGRQIFSNGKEIGKYHCNLNDIQGSLRYLALVKALVVDGESYQQGIAVWDDSKQQWQNIDAEEVASLIGWIKQ